MVRSLEWQANPAPYAKNRDRWKKTTLTRQGTNDAVNQRG